MEDDARFAGELEVGRQGCVYHIAYMRHVICRDPLPEPVLTRGNQRCIVEDVLDVFCLVHSRGLLVDARYERGVELSFPERDDDTCKRLNVVVQIERYTIGEFLAQRDRYNYIGKKRLAFTHSAKITKKPPRATGGFLCVVCLYQGQ